MPDKTRDIPVIYSPEYKIRIPGSRFLHAFDARKGARVFKILTESGFFGSGQAIKPSPFNEEDLGLVHSAAYLESLRNSRAWSRILQIPLLRYLPVSWIRHMILKPMLAQTAGTVAAGEAALSNGWAVNLGGGFHHASFHRGEGFCAVADITLSILKLRENNPHIRKVAIVDFDAHQGNGHERDFMNDEDVFIADIFHGRIYPDDREAMQKIGARAIVGPHTNDQDYLQAVSTVFAKVSSNFKPDIIYYVAGTDIVRGDPLARMSVSEEGLIKRDEMVFDYAKELNVPVVMLFGGGYQRSNAPLIARSLINLNRHFGLV